MMMTLPLLENPQPTSMFICPICGAPYTKMMHMKGHFRKVHTFNHCPVCNIPLDMNRIGFHFFTINDEEHLPWRYLFYTGHRNGSNIERYKEALNAAMIKFKEMPSK